MLKNEVIKLYAEQEGITFEEARNTATPYELFQAFLHEEGIFGYTDMIITTFREIYDID